MFLLARIKEAHDAGAPNSQAVALGLERTGRIVTSAALLFAVAVGAFATSQIVFIKELGIGTALAVAAGRLNRPRAAGPVAHGTARLRQLVGAPSAAGACTNGSGSAEHRAGERRDRRCQSQ